MPEKKERKEKLSIYLAKNHAGLDSALIKVDQADFPISLKLAEVKSALLYIKKTPAVHSPSWTRLFTSLPEIGDDAFGESSSVGAALILKLRENKFVITFGTGFHLLHDDAIERDFGLKVTLNSVDPEKLRSLDKSSYDHKPLNSRNQSIKEVDIFDLRIDSEVEMLYAVTGASAVDVFGSHVTGRDALTVVTSSSMNELYKILDEAIFRYGMQLPEAFEWVDNVNRVRDSDYIEILDLELDELLLSNSVSNLWLGEPEIVDWEHQVGYSFNMHARTERYSVLDINSLFDYLKLKSIVPSVEALKSIQVHVNDVNYQSSKVWAAYKCLYAEIKYGSNQYIMRNGMWYKVNSDFVKRIDAQLSTLGTYEHVFPVYEHDREEDYNFSLTSDASFELLDKKNIRIGGAYDKLEFCDLIRNGNDLIHVKYYRSSGTLSHLFSQGCVSAEAFITDVNFRVKLNDKLPSSIKLARPDARPNPGDYKIVYAIATSKKLPSELPFFSKVTLKNAMKVLQGLNYSVEIVAIDVDPLLKVKKSYKAK
jgi:uncharacterized protein (TIGR04141 family)